MKQRIVITGDKANIERLDRMRGLIPRSTYVNNLIEKNYNKKGVK